MDGKSFFLDDRAMNGSTKVQSSQANSGCILSGAKRVHPVIVGWSTANRPLLPSDNGPEFVSKALLPWIVAQGIGTALIEPGKPWQNGVAESFNGKFRDECLSLEWFRSRAEAKVLIEEWRRHFNGYVRIRASAISRRTSLRYTGPPRPGPLLNRPRGDKCSKQGKPSQANRGPKNLGRSRTVGNVGSHPPSRI
jgi:Integrase core domain